MSRQSAIHLVDVVILCGLLLSVCFCVATRCNVITADELISNGFTIIDPTGKRVTRFACDRSGWFHYTESDE